MFAHTFGICEEKLRNEKMSIFTVQSSLVSARKVVLVHRQIV